MNSTSCNYKKKITLQILKDILEKHYYRWDYVYVFCFSIEILIVQHRNSA